MASAQSAGAVDDAAVNDAALASAMALAASSLRTSEECAREANSAETSAREAECPFSRVISPVFLTICSWCLFFCTAIRILLAGVCIEVLCGLSFARGVKDTPGPLRRTAAQAPSSAVHSHMLRLRIQKSRTSYNLQCLRSPSSDAASQSHLMLTRARSAIYLHRRRGS